MSRDIQPEQPSNNTEAKYRLFSPLAIAAGILTVGYLVEKQIAELAPMEPITAMAAAGCLIGDIIVKRGQPPTE